MALGRPREFDVEKALDQALNVFWRNGYEGASISDLTDAMGISPPSLYAAFGNKEGLFRQALDRYVQLRTEFWMKAMDEPTARGAVEHLLRKSCEFLTEECNPPGCLLVRSTMLCSEAEDLIKRELAVRHAQAEAALRERFEAARRSGEVPDSFRPADYARFVMAMLEGMSVRAAGGATREELDQIADVALKAWPV